MRGFTYAGPGVPAQLTELPTPEPGPGELRIRVGANTVCGTDLRILRGEKSKGVRLGAVLGHEVAGYVDAVGEGVEGFARATWSPCRHRCAAGCAGRAGAAPSTCARTSIWSATTSTAGWPTTC